MPGASAAGIRVVIAEDHEEARQTLARMINLQESMEVVGEAADGVEALELVKEYSPDVLLVDIRMPRMDGISVIKNLRGNGNDLRVIVLSAHEDETYVAEAIKQGADAYMLKGMSIQKIVEAIGEVFKGKAILSPDITRPLVKNYRQADAIVTGFHQTLDTSGGLEGMVKRFLEELTRLLEADFSCVLRTTEKHSSGFELVQYCHGAGAESAREDGWMKWLTWMKWLSYNLRELAGRATGTDPVVLNDYRYVNDESAAIDMTTNILLVPINTWSGQRGQLLCFREKPFSSSTIDTRYIYPMVGQLGLLLENLAQVELARDLGRELETKNTLLRSMLAALLDTYELEATRPGEPREIAGIFIAANPLETPSFECLMSSNVDEDAVSRFMSGTGEALLRKLVMERTQVDLCLVGGACGGMLLESRPGGMHLLLVPLLATRREGPAATGSRPDGSRSAPEGFADALRPGGGAGAPAGDGREPLLGVLGIFHTNGGRLSPAEEFRIGCFARRVAEHIEGDLRTRNRVL